jgi:nucleotide-binding universal stress UspA family protein
MSNILLATDFSPASAAAEQEAIDLAQKLGATITVFHAYDIMPALMYPNGMFYTRTPELLDELKSAVRESLAAVVTRIGARGVRAEARSAEGRAHEEIIRLANEGDFDLVVMGTHGRTGLKQFWLGSVAEKVIRQCRRPVVTVRGDAADAEAAVAPSAQPGAH